MTSDWDRLASEITRVERIYAGGHPPQESKEELSDSAADYSGETRSRMIEARIGQGFFRRSVLSAYAFKCCITGIAIPELLVASHIVPWRDNPSNRLNPRNGLCLSAIHDRAFDQGLIAFSDDLRLLVSSRLRLGGANSYIGHTFRSYAGKAATPPDKFGPDSDFLKYHRENIFKE
jgi:predicted restriction endonuclease